MVKASINSPKLSSRTTRISTVLSKAIETKEFCTRDETPRLTNSSTLIRSQQQSSTEITRMNCVTARALSKTRRVAYSVIAMIGIVSAVSEQDVMTLEKSLIPSSMKVENPASAVRDGD